MGNPMHFAHGLCLRLLNVFTVFASQRESEVEVKCCEYSKWFQSGIEKLKFLMKDTR